MTTAPFCIFIRILRILWVVFLIVHPCTVLFCQVSFFKGAIVKGDTTSRSLALIFSGDEYGEGLRFIRRTLKNKDLKASFFFTGRMYRNPKFTAPIKRLIKDGHYLGGHSDQHLLYCDWTQRDSLLVTKQEFDEDLDQNYKAMEDLRVNVSKSIYFLPPYEWYNDTISYWAREKGIQLINFSPGTLSHTDYTTLKDKNYRPNKTIFDSILRFEQSHSAGLRGFILLMHAGAGPDRTEKFFLRLPELLDYLSLKGYSIKTIAELLN